MNYIRGQILPFTLVFLCLVGIGALAIQDYGISSDEPAMYTFGVQVYAYLFLDGPVPAVQDWAFHNPIFHVLLTAIQRIFDITSARSIWLMRHFVTYLLFLCGVGIFYRLTVSLLKNRKIACIGTVFLLLSPLIFAHSVYNPKDIPTLVCFIFAISALLAWRRRLYALRWALPVALMCALAMSLRSFGLILPVLVLLLLAMDTLPNNPRRFSQGTIMFLGALCVLLIVVWPRLWTHPAVHLLTAFGTSVAHGGMQTPWYYVPAWIIATTPLLYTALFCIGCIALVPHLRTRPEWRIILLWFFVPVITVMLPQFNVFDGWRHVFFVYPAFLLIALFGLQYLLTISSDAVRITTGIVTLLSIVWTALWMTLHHPLQFAYFSLPVSITGDFFDVDYWGMSHYSGLKWILEHDDRRAIPVYTKARVGAVSADIFPRTQWQRLHFVSPASADYIVQNFRQKSTEQLLPDSRIVYEIVLGGRTLLAIYKGPDTDNLYEEHREY